MRPLILPLLLTSITALAQDWPEFRGPDKQGNSTATGLPTDWNPNLNKNIVWKAALPGVGWSSPVVVGDRIYVTSAVPVGGEEKPVVDRSLRALCVSATDGKVIWDKEVFPQIAATAPNIHKKNSHASPTAIFEADKLYVHFGHQGTACLNAADGSIVVGAAALRKRALESKRTVTSVKRLINPAFSFFTKRRITAPTSGRNVIMERRLLMIRP